MYNILHIIPLFVKCFFRNFQDFLPWYLRTVRKKKRKKMAGMKVRLCRVSPPGCGGLRECPVSIEPYLGCGLSGLRRLEKFPALEIEHAGEE